MHIYIQTGNSGTGGVSSLGTLDIVEEKGQEVVDCVAECVAM